MSSLLTAVTAERSARRRSECNVSLLIKQLTAGSKTDRAIARDLPAVLANLDLSAPEISRGLARLGHTLGPAPISRHRRGECACNR